VLARLAAHVGLVYFHRTKQRAGQFIRHSEPDAVRAAGGVRGEAEETVNRLREAAQRAVDAASLPSVAEQTGMVPDRLQPFLADRAPGAGTAKPKTKKGALG
jgi:hypothetical protein